MDPNTSPHRRPWDNHWGKVLTAAGILLGGLFYARSGVTDRLERLEARVERLGGQVDTLAAEIRHRERKK